MKLNVDKALLVKALAKINLTVESSSEIEAYTYVSMKARGETLSLQGVRRTGTRGGSLSCRVDLPVEIEEEGSLCIKAKLLSKIGASLAGDSVSFKLKGDVARVVSSRSKFNLKTINVDSFPPSGVDYQTIDFKPIDMVKFLQAIARTVFCTDASHHQTYAKGVRLCKNFVVGTDTNRLALYALPVMPVSSPVIIPTFSIAAILKILSATPETQGYIGFSEHPNTKEPTAVHFLCGGVYVSTALYNTTYPHFGGVVPNEDKITNRITFGQELVESLSRCRIMTPEVKFVVGGGRWELSGTSDHGDVNESGFCDYTGPDYTSNLNCRYFYEGLSYAGSDEFFMNFYVPPGVNNAAIMIESGEYKNVILPIRIES